MSIAVMTVVWENSEHKGSELLTLLAIADNANDDGLAWPGYEFLAAKTRLSVRGVQYVVKKLLASDELELLERGKRGKSNRYRVCSQTLRGKRALGCKTEHVSSQELLHPNHQEPKAPSDEGARTARSDSERARVYEALVVAYFPEGAGAALTKREAQKVGMASVDIRKAGGMAEDVPVRAAKLAKVMPPGTTLTPMALASNWALAAAPAAASDPGCPYCLMRGGQHSSECEAVRPGAEDGAP